VQQGAIVQVQLRADSDLLLTVVAETLSLVPGSLVLDLDRESRLISIHLLHVDDLADVERQKADVLATEELIVRAFGTAEDIAALEAARPTGRTTR
jgi:multicomponent Na+:H+ antiporter subunit E